MKIKIYNGFKMTSKVFECNCEKGHEIWAKQEEPICCELIQSRELKNSLTHKIRKVIWKKIEDPFLS
jgi:hypothetical protein